MNGMVFVWDDLPYESFGVDEVVRIGQYRYLLMGFEGFFSLCCERSVGLRVKCLDSAVNAG